MRTVSGFLVGVVASLLCLSLATSASAANREDSWEVGAYVPYYFFDDPLEGAVSLNSAPGVGIRGGYNITENHEIEMSLVGIASDFDDNLIFAGGGIRRFFNRTFGLRFEGAFMVVDDEDDTLTHMYVGLGASFVLGG